MRQSLRIEGCCREGRATWGSGPSRKTSRIRSRCVGWHRFCPTWWTSITDCRRSASAVILAARCRCGAVVGLVAAEPSSTSAKCGVCSWAQADRALAAALVPIAHTVLMLDDRNSCDLLSVLIWLLFVFSMWTSRAARTAVA